MNHKTLAAEVILTEANALKSLIERLDKNFDQAIDVMANCSGRVVISGMGKTGLIGRKIAATLSSTGTPSIFMHSAEAAHGDFGQLTKDDVLILISGSGETEETVRLIPMVKKLDIPLMVLTGRHQSTLAQNADIILDVGVAEEGCPLGLAPMASTTATLAMGDALAACLIEKKGFQQQDFAVFHPGGSLGRRLLMTVKDVMRVGSRLPAVQAHILVKDVLFIITRCRCGSACVVDDKQILLGIFTDGDLRRCLSLNQNVLNQKVSEVMTTSPIIVADDMMAVDAMQIMQDKSIDEIAVIDSDKKLVGLLDIQDILQAGLT